MASQTTSDWVEITAAAGSLAAPATPGATNVGGSLTALHDGRGRLSPAIEIGLEAGEDDVTLTDAQVWIDEGDGFELLAQAGGDATLFDSVVIPAGFKMRFTLGGLGRATRLAISGTLDQGELGVYAKRIDDQ